MSLRSARLLRVALLVLLGVASVWAFGWECAARRHTVAVRDATAGALANRVR